MSGGPRVGARSWLGAAALLLLAAARPAVADDALVAHDRVPAVAYVVAPKQQPARAPISALIGALAAELETRTDLELVPLERAGVDVAELDACPSEERLGCWARLVSGASDSRATGPGAPRWLFVIAARAKGGSTDVLSLMLLDLGAAAELRAEGGDAEAIESGIFAKTASTQPEPVDGSSPDELRSYFARSLDEGLRPTLESKGHASPFGRIVLEGTRAGTPLFLDGIPLGTTRDHETEIRDVRPGARRVALGTSVEQQVEVYVARGLVARTKLAQPSGASISARSVTLWSGVAVATVGVALTALAVVKASDDLRSACLVRKGDEGAACPSIGTLTFGYDPSRAPTTDLSTVNPPGLMIAPFGLALVAAGGTWTAGAALSGSDDLPWLPIVLGVAAAGLTYGAGVLLDPR